MFSCAYDVAMEEAKPLSADEKRLIDAAIARGRANGLKMIALIVGRDERTVRRMYETDPSVRDRIQKTGGRYWAKPGDLWPLSMRIEGRRKRARQASALQQARTTRGRFASRKKKFSSG